MTYIPEGFTAPINDKFTVGEGGRLTIESENGCKVRFFEKEYKLEKISKETGLPLHKTRVYCEMILGFDPKNRHTHLVSERDDCEFKLRFPREWNYFLQWKEHSGKGTPVLNWGELTPDKQANLTAYGIVTLEQILQADIEILDKLTAGEGRKVFEAASAQINYKEKLADVTVVAKKLAATADELESSKDLIEKLSQEKDALREALKMEKAKLSGSRSVQARLVRAEKAKVLQETAERLEKEESTEPEEESKEKKLT